MIPDYLKKIPESSSWVREARWRVEHDLDDIPGIINEDPWSDRSLKDIETEFLKIPETEVSKSTERTYLQFLGNGLVQLFNGCWVSIDPKDLGLDFDESPLIGVAYPGPSHIDIVSNLVTTARIFRTGYYWSSIFQTTRSTLT